MKGFLVLETGEAYQGDWKSGRDRAGEVVFNTSHCGYEEMATDPSYFSQILLTTAPMQGNYGVNKDFWESRQLWIEGFICTEVQNTKGNSSWLKRLDDFGVGCLDNLDTRSVVLHLRERGAAWGALVKESNEQEAKKKAFALITEKKKEEKDWVHRVSIQERTTVAGDCSNGPKVAVMDFGCKENILRNLKKFSSEIAIFPSRSSSQEILDWCPDGIMLSNGPGDPSEVQEAVETVKNLLGKKFIFGICMGHQILSLALGAKTFKLKFGHRGGNHPVRDKVLHLIYMTSQNHGYAVEMKSLPESVEVTHVNLNDETVSGIRCLDKKCMGVQFHPESHPGPRDAEGLFEYFIDQLPKH